MSILDFLRAAGAILPDVNFKTADWAIYVNDAAGIVTDEDEIEQTMILICSTAIGSDPLRPEFGCAFLPVLDMPMNRAAPLLVARITNALATWERRIQVLSTVVAADIQGILRVTVIWQRANATTVGTAGAIRTISFALK